MQTIAEHDSRNVRIIEEHGIFRSIIISIENGEYPVGNVEVSISEYLPEQHPAPVRVDRDAQAVVSLQRSRLYLRRSHTHTEMEHSQQAVLLLERGMAGATGAEHRA